MRRVVDHLAGLVVLPVVILCFGSSWRLAGLDVEVDQRWLIVLIWGLWLALLRLSDRDPRRDGGVGRSAGQLLALWRRADPLLAGLLAYLVLFRFEGALWGSLVLLGLVLAAFVGLARASGPVLVALLTALLVFGVALPRAFRSRLTARLASTYTMDVDHRMYPDGGEINSDSARFIGEAADLSDADFVILFLGDSFTFGFNLPYEDAYPYQLEALTRDLECDAPVRAVDFGWTSASPLLSLRLLRQVGYKYRPDLVVYSVDMTDFHDDLRYEAQLRDKADIDYDTGAVLARLIAMEAPWATPALPLLRGVASRLRRRGEPVSGTGGIFGEPGMPERRDRYFATRLPLARSRAGIERGVMRNLAALDAHTRDVLDAEFAVVVYPRAYQYSTRESPNNWEAPDYEKLGPNVRAPFEYFAAVAPELTYPVFDLLPAFEGSERFPLYFGNDPHWNEHGAALTAESVLAGLVRTGLVPCSGGPPVSSK